MPFDFPSFVSGLLAIVGDFLLSPPASYFLGCWLVIVVVSLFNRITRL